VGAANRGELGAGKILRGFQPHLNPRSGGGLIDYFDPANEDDAFTKIERLLLDPDYLTEREAQLRSEYRPRTWADCVRALVATFDQTTPYDQLVKDSIGEADREIDQLGEKTQLRCHGGPP
jgi:hypothetical protein